MKSLITSFALTCALLPSPQVEEAPLFNAPDGMKQEQVDRILKTRMEEHLGFAIYKPKSVSAESLVDYLEALTNRPLTFYTMTPSGQLIPEEGIRFLVMEDAVGVQEFSDRIEGILVQLDELDNSVAPLEGTSDVGTSTSHETIRLSNINGKFVHDLIGPTCPFVSSGSMDGTSLITLTGPTAEVERAVSILKDADKPLPQIVLQWTLLEAVDEVGPKEAAAAEVTNALQPFAPGKRFRQGNTFTVRGVAGGDEILRVSSGLKGLQGVAPNLPSEVSLSAVATGFDEEAKQLHLKNCEITVQRTEEIRGPNGTNRHHNTDELSTSLSLRAGETTVLGSLGGDPIWVALTFTLIP